MYNLIVCIPTYQRPLMLKDLILSIFENKIDKLLINDVSIIIVDNDKDKTAESIVNEIKEGFDRTYKLHYFNHPVKGLSNVRNELLNKALLQKPDFIIFIDDDEFVTPYWLIELLKTIINNNADAARGPVIAKFTNRISKYVSCFFEREEYPDNAQVFSFTTGNLILRRKSLEKYNVWFDNRFNYIGSEDSFFGIQMMKKGATIYWAANAIVFETIPTKRAKLRWLIKKTYNGAITFIYILKLEKNYFGLLKKTIINVVYFLSGSLALVVLYLRFQKALVDLQDYLASNFVSMQRIDDMFYLNSSFSNQSIFLIKMLLITTHSPLI
jgi:succinoglycan biosynthesis protein ExoM